MKVALRMTEDQFVTELEGIVKGVDKSATIVPLEARTSTKITSIKYFTVGILSPSILSGQMFDVLKEYAKPQKDVVDYKGWTLSVEDKTFKTVIHSIEVKLNEKKGC